MKHKKDEIRDFLKDEYFVNWVYHPDAQSDAYWKNWMKQHPDKLKEIKLAREIISSFQYQHTYNLPPATYAGILDTLRAKQRNARYDKKRESGWGFRVAATLLLLVLGSITVWYFSQSELTKDKEPISLMVKRTQKGEKLTIRLPDGTKVKLNANSILVYPAVFDHQTRYVKLEGEALFDVVKDAARPFTIMSGEVQTRVLGTSFNVRAYEDEPDVAVAVVSGKVSVRGNGMEEVFLSPNEVSYYHKSDHHLSTTNKDVSDLIAWSKNILIFDEDTAEEVWKKLENWYGVNIIIPNRPVIKGKYSGRYYNESLERVLDGISYASEFVYEMQKNKNVIIKELPVEHKKAN